MYYLPNARAINYYRIYVTTRQSFFKKKKKFSQAEQEFTEKVQHEILSFWRAWPWNEFIVIKLGTNSYSCEHAAITVSLIPTSVSQFQVVAGCHAKFGSTS